MHLLETPRGEGASWEEGKKEVIWEAYHWSRPERAGNQPIQSLPATFYRRTSRRRWAGIDDCAQLWLGPSLSTGGKKRKAISLHAQTTEPFLRSDQIFIHPGKCTRSFHMDVHTLVCPKADTHQSAHQARICPHTGRQMCAMR